MPGLALLLMEVLLLFKQCLGIINLGAVGLAAKVVVIMVGFNLKFVKIV
jgi:hypothetical protein